MKIRDESKTHRLFPSMYGVPHSTNGGIGPSPTILKYTTPLFRPSGSFEAPEPDHHKGWSLRGEGEGRAFGRERHRESPTTTRDGRRWGGSNLPKGQRGLQRLHDCARNGRDCHILQLLILCTLK